MAEAELIDGLIATYRDLNLKARPLPEERLQRPAADGSSVRSLITRLRDHELLFSQALKQRLTGIPMPDFGEEQPAVIGPDESHSSTGILLSQFGTARESTLAMLRSMPAEEWDRPVESGQPIRVRVQQLVESDRRHMERIVGLLGGA